MRLRDKFEYIEALKPDITIIQECEYQHESYFPGAKYIWIDRNRRKGLGVLSFSIQMETEDLFNDRLIYYLPLNLNSGQIKLLALWAYNHRAPGQFGENTHGQPYKAIEYYHNWLSGTKIIVAGDFNNSVIWDKPKGKNNFSAIDQSLSRYGLDSAYHKHYGLEMGKEIHGTLYHQKQAHKPYHIDYVYLNETAIHDVRIGDYETWITLSDHMPVIVDTNDFSPLTTGTPACPIVR